MWKIVAVIAAVSIGATVALAPCDEDIIAKLKTTAECYTNGKPPALTATGVLGTHVRISSGELPEDTKCVTALQHDGVADVTIFLNDGGNTSYTMKHEPDTENGYILETDSSFNRFLLYIIHNKQYVYTYYRCINGTTGGNGKPVGDVAVGCKYVNDEESKAVIAMAETCFKKLDIDLVELTPCDCDC